jgi:hypothetical protein
MSGECIIQIGDSSEGEEAVMGQQAPVDLVVRLSNSRPEPASAGKKRVVADEDEDVVREKFGLDPQDKVLHAIYASIYGVAKLPDWTATSIAPSDVRRKVAELRDSPTNPIAPSDLRRKVADLLQASPNVAPETVSQVEKLLETRRSTWQEVVSQVEKFLETPRGTWQEVVILALDQVHPALEEALEEAQEEEEAQLVVGAKIAKALEEPNGSIGIEFMRVIGELFSPEVKHILDLLLKPGGGDRAPRDSEGRPIIVIGKTEDWPLDPAKAPREAFAAQHRHHFESEMAKRQKK